MPLSPADVRALDANAAALGVPTSVLMENAGTAVADYVARRWQTGRILVLAGLGNNGGDGAVAARVLHERGRKVKLLLAGRPEEIRSDIARAAWAQAEAAGVPVVPFSDVVLADLLDEADLAVDALLGVGVSGPLRPPYDTIVRAIDEQETPTVAVDLPTGHGGSDAVYALATVTFHDEKVGMDPEVCGDIVVADIGIPADAGRFVGPGDLSARFPRTPRDARKGRMGRLLIVGGGPYTGAPVLAGLAAAATGTDLIHMALPGRAADVAQHHLLEAIVHPLEGPRLVPEHLDLVAPLVRDSSVVLLGPGLGKQDGTLAAARAIVEEAVDAGKMLVLDADAFSALAGMDGARDLEAVLTPHAGEFARLSGMDVGPLGAEARMEAVQGWLGGGRAVVLLKGPTDVIVGPGQVVQNRVHHPVMTTGGTGDILAGVVTALVGRGASRFDAARLGAYLVGAAGQRAYEGRGFGVKASDLVAEIPLVLRAHVP